MARPLLTAEERKYTQELRAWRERRGLTKKALAVAISYDPSRVSHIEAGRQPPTEEFTRQAEAVLQTGGVLWACWETIAAERFGLPRRPPERDLRTAEFVGWLADHSATSFQETYAAVSSMAARIEALPPSMRHGDHHARQGITRASAAEAVIRYYNRPGPGSFYRADVGSAHLELSVLTDPRWLNIVQLGTDQERARLLPTPAPVPRLDELAAGAAARRLATVEFMETVLVDNPLYRLVDVELGPATLAATFDLTSFAAYALTADLLEEELTDSLVRSSDSMPLRATYLPSRRSALAFADRTCVGGPVALTAIARQRPGAPPDYLLLIQERSDAVLNVTGRLAVIPKAFHQPLGEPAGEAAVSVTLERELEEELLGRADLEQLTRTSEDSRRVAPLHHHRSSEALAWLVQRRAAGAYRTECTGFGINMVTGNYEVACLIVIDDHTWWDTFGHLVEWNWEAQHVRSISSLDTAALQELATDPRWSNEGLFAFVQGLRRLADTDTAGRVAAPAINVEP